MALRQVHRSSPRVPSQEDHLPMFYGNIPGGIQSLIVAQELLCFVGQRTFAEISTFPGQFHMPGDSFRQMPLVKTIPEFSARFDGQEPDCEPKRDCEPW